MTDEHEGPPSSLHVRVLGAVTVSGPSGDVPVRGRQPSAVTAHLALQPRGATRDDLAAVLWGPHPSPHWRGALRGVLSKVRAALVEAGLTGEALRSDDTVVLLDVGVVRTDLDDIETLLDDRDAAIDDLGDAIDALAHPFLPADDSDWGRRVRQRIDATTRRAVHRVALTLAAAGRVDDAAERLEHAIGRDPLDETAHHHLIAILLEGGRQAAASLAYERLSLTLADEFGIAPAAETTVLLERAVGRAPSAAEPTSAVAATATAPEPAAAPIHPHAADPFVGRTAELERLDRIWRTVVADRRPQLVVLEGPAGIGKTRLADRFCRRLHETGSVERLLWGRNRDHANRAYGALADAIERVSADRPLDAERLDDDLATLMGLRGGAELRDRVNATIDPAMQPTLVRAVRSFVARLAQHPSILFIDDLQWSSADDLGLIEHALDGLVGPLMIVATSRLPPPDVANALASIQRIVPTTTLTLEPLTTAELEELIPDGVGAAQVRARTGGLPFYASEIARLARSSTESIAVSDVPPVVSDWVRRRLLGLDRDLGHLLELASVIDGDIDLALLTECSSLDGDDVAAAIDRLVATGLLTTGSDGHVQFSHDLTRDVVYDSVGPATRTHLHRHVAASLVTADRPGTGTDAQLAHHFARAGHEMRPQATAHATRAGTQSLGVAAWSSAAAHFAAALETATSPAERANALIGLGRARLAEGDFAVAAELLTEASDIAADHGLATVAARAVLALVGRAGRGALHHDPDEEHIRLLRRSLTAVAAVDPRSVAEEDLALPEIISDLERELAYSLLLSDAADERASLLHGSLERMRSLQPRLPRPLANALLGVRYAQLDPSLLDQRLADIDEVLDLPAAQVGKDVLLAARCYQFEDLLRRGDFGRAQHVLDRAERLAGEFPDPYWVWSTRTWRVVQDVLDGELERAEATAFDAAAMRPGVPGATACLGVNLVNLRLYQGRGEEMIPILEQAANDHPEIPTYRAVLALCAVESGHEDLAARLLEQFGERRFDDLPHDTNRFLGLAVLAHVAATVGATDLSPALAALLDPYREQWVVLNCYGGGGAVWGPTSHALGRLALLEGDAERAASLFEQARRQAATAPRVLERIERDRFDADRLAG